MPRPRRLTHPGPASSGIWDGTGPGGGMFRKDGRIVAGLGKLTEDEVLGWSFGEMELPGGGGTYVLLTPA